MPHFAEIDPETNIVRRVVRARTAAWCEENLGGTWVRTFYDTPPKGLRGRWL